MHLPVFKEGLIDICYWMYCMLVKKNTIIFVFILLSFSTLNGNMGTCSCYPAGYIFRILLCSLHGKCAYRTINILVLTKEPSNILNTVNLLQLFQLLFSLSNSNHELFNLVSVSHLCLLQF